MFDINHHSPVVLDADLEALRDLAMNRAQIPHHDVVITLLGFVAVGLVRLC
jgi:hypothetical protein